MTKSEALALLQLEASASEKQIRSCLFRKYQEISHSLAELEDERQRPLLEVQLQRIEAARDILLAEGSVPLNIPDALPEFVFVLLYHKHGQEGIHTLEIQGQNTVLAFESQFAARKYAQRLAQQGLPKPKTERFETQEIVDFCRAAQHGLSIIPESETVDPPESSTGYSEDW
jgi:hypothetical protein